MLYNQKLMVSLNFSQMAKMAMMCLELMDVILLRAFDDSILHLYLSIELHHIWMK